MVEDFALQYNKLSENEINYFALLVNKLINVNFVTGVKEENSKDYYFISSNFDLFKSYFRLSQMELIHNKSNKVVVLKRNYGRTLNLGKLESALLLILRLLYNQKLKEISLSSKIVARQLEIREKYEQIGITNSEKLNTNNLRLAMRIFKKYNLVDYKGQDFRNDDFLITIYPTIQYVIEAEDINLLVSKLNCYKEKEEVVNEEISED